LEQANHALLQLRQAFRTFAFADRKTKSEDFDIDGEQVAIEVTDLDKPPAHDETGFLHALLTAACRSALWLAPAFAYRSPAISGSGTGKGLLAKVPALICYGELPHNAGLGSGGEFEKGLVAALMRGGHSILVDNVNNRTLSSNTLCTVLTERPCFLRVLARSQLVPANSSAFISITGCALSIGRDLVRRIVTIDLDAKIEDPEQRKFCGDFLTDITARRIELLQYVFTILRWARQNRSKLKRGKPLGSYGQ